MSNQTNLTEFCLVSKVETLITTIPKWAAENRVSTIAVAIIARLAAALLSPAAAIDLCFHAILVIPTFVIALASSLWNWKTDFTMPWQHVQRARNAIAPLVLGSAAGLIHPMAGIFFSEPTDKHAAVGMLGAGINDPETKKKILTPCSPVDSLSLIETLAKAQPTADDGTEIFSDEQIDAIRGAKSLEGSLEALQAQEALHRWVNGSHLVTKKLLDLLGYFELDPVACSWGKWLAIRAVGLLLFPLALIDCTLALLLQALFIVTGVVRLISGRGPAYTESTQNLSFHVGFLLQNVFKTIGTLVGSLVWLISPEKGRQAGLVAGNLIFQLQFECLMLSLRWQMHLAQEGECFLVPIASSGDQIDHGFPDHMTYSVVQKTKDPSSNEPRFIEHRVDRGVKNVFSSSEQTPEEIRTRIRKKLTSRFQCMNAEQMMRKNMYSDPYLLCFALKERSRSLDPQGLPRNCVVSNLFAALEQIDHLKHKEPDLCAGERRWTMFGALIKKYSFYKNDFFPLISMSTLWSDIEYADARASI